MDSLFTLGARAGALLIARDETIAVGETSAGGLISAALLAVPGASRYFVGAAVPYSLASIRGLVGIPMDTLQARGIRSSSEPYALILADALREKHGGCTWGLSETGAAGPSGNRYGDPPGHTCLAVTGAQRAVRTLRTGSADRAANMQVFAEAALALLLTVLEAPKA